MKTQTMKNKISMLLFTAVASLVMMNAACQKNSGGGEPPPPPVVVPPMCGSVACPNGIVGGQMLYGGTATAQMMGIQAQFQVNGDVSGNGMGSISGSINFGGNGFVCQIGMPNLTGPYNIQMTQQGYLQSDVFMGQVLLQGPAGTLPAMVKVVPSRTQGAGLFSLQMSQCQSYYPIDMNF